MKRRDFFNFFSSVTASLFLKPLSTGSLPEITRKRSYSSSMDPWLEIDLKAIKWNFNQIKKRAGAKVMAVVKANAYGHGLIPVARALEEAGVDWLMVGKLEEALSLKAAGLKSPILNFGPFGRQDAEIIVQSRLSQSIYSEDVFFLAEEAARKNRRASIHIDLDTGMGRTGLPYNRALPLIERIARNRHLQIEGLSTTLTEDPEFDREQIRRLNEVYYKAKERGISCGLRHAASSAGLLTSPEFYLDMVRPGITLYGYYPNEKTQKEDPLQLLPALRLKARVTFIKDLEPGETLSYHRVFRAQKKMRVATLGLGYSDGYQAQLGGQGWAIIMGKKFPVLPLVTANHLMIDLEADDEVKIGDEAILIDSQIDSPATASALATSSGISTYRLLIGLNPLLPRRYL